MSTVARNELLPSSRTVLLRGYGPEGFIFYTNYGSRKAAELDSNLCACLLFYWREVSRQVRLAGRVERTTREENERYFRTRPRLSRLSAWASRQSEPIPDREFLAARMRELEKKFPGEDIPLPPFWGGYRVLPDSYEFWQEGEHRLHDRFRYKKSNVGVWVIERLAP